MWRIKDNGINRLESWYLNKQLRRTREIMIWNKASRGRKRKKRKNRFIKGIISINILFLGNRFKADINQSDILRKLKKGNEVQIIWIIRTYKGVKKRPKTLRLV